MKYFFISDVHGQFNKMIEALQNAGFNKDQDTLVNLGDPFDRGPQSKEVLEYLLSCPHRILIWGNHDFRLKQLLTNDFISYADIENGVPHTLTSFTLVGPQAGLDTQIFLLKEDICYEDIRKKIWQYFRECKNAVEFDNLIATHAWLPVISIDKKYVNMKEELIYALNPQWRQIKQQNIWEDAMWCHSEKMYEQHCLPDKPFLIGHWHAWRFATRAGEKRFDRNSIKELKYKDYINCDKWSSADGKLTAIDGCSNWPNGGKVNVYIYESNKEPILY